MKSWFLALIITNWPINQLRKDVREKTWDQMFLEFYCGHFETKMESLRPSYQKLVFCPYLGMGVAHEKVLESILSSSKYLLQLLEPYYTL